MNGLQRKCLFAMLVMGAILIYRIVFMYYYTMRCHICIALLRDHICGRLFLYIQWCCRCCWLHFIILNAHHVNLLHHYRHGWISATIAINNQNQIVNLEKAFCLLLLFSAVYGISNFKQQTFCCSWHITITSPLEKIKRLWAQTHFHLPKYEAHNYGKN